MELNCPSCSSKHRTEDYPGAFEIQCACGYSILVPDEDALVAPASSTESPEAYDFSSPPMAMDAEDDQRTINVEELNKATALHEVLTPPDQLPEGMVYDAFELAQNFGNSATDNEPAKALDEFSESSEVGGEAEAPVEVSFSAAPVGDSGTQKLLQNAQSASVGQLIGNSYNLIFSKEKMEKRQDLLDRCEDMLKQRPWLANKIKTDGIDIQSLLQSDRIEKIPELLAVEIFLSCLELGIACDFEKSL